jgi:hypothetical protein
MFVISADGLSHNSYGIPNSTFTPLSLKIYISNTGKILHIDDTVTVSNTEQPEHNITIKANKSGMLKFCLTIQILLNSVIYKNNKMTSAQNITDKIFITEHWWITAGFIKCVSFCMDLKMENLITNKRKFYVDSRNYSV